MTTKKLTITWNDTNATMTTAENTPLITPEDLPAVEVTGALAMALAAHAKEAIGPEGSIVRISDKTEADLVRATFVSKIAAKAADLLEKQEETP